MSARSTLRQWLAEGETERALTALQHIADNAGDQPFADDVTYLSGRYRTLERERHRGAISDDAYRAESAKVREALLALIRQAPADAVLDLSLFPPEEGRSTVGNAHRSRLATLFPWAIGLALFIGATVTLPGFFPCNTSPFEYTISLQPDNNIGLSPRYPELEEAVLHIRLDNKWEPTEVGRNGDADYKTLPGGFKGKQVAARLDAKYWQLEKDSVVLVGKSALLPIAPDGSLGTVAGKVMDSVTGEPLKGASVEVLGVAVPSDEKGNFTLRIPLSKQAADQVVDITLDGYRPYRGNVTPATGAPLRALLTKR